MVASDVTSAYARVHTFCRISGKLSHPFIAESNTVAITEGCKAVSAPLNTKQLSSAVHTSYASLISSAHLHLWVYVYGLLLPKTAGVLN